MYKSKITNTIKYSVLLLALICVFQIPTKASAAMSLTPTPTFILNTNTTVDNYVDAALYCVSKVISLFKEFPLNIILAFMVASVILGIFMKAKRTAR